MAVYIGILRVQRQPCTGHKCLIRGVLVMVMQAAEVLW